MAKAAKTVAAETPVGPNGEKQGDRAKTEAGEPIVFDNGAWRLMTPEELAVPALPASTPAPASAFAPVPKPGFVTGGVLGAPDAGPPGGIAVAQDGSTATVSKPEGGVEIIPVPHQEVNMDGHHKEAAISLHSPVGATGKPIDNDAVGTLTNKLNTVTNERDRLLLERDRLLMINDQLREANSMAAKHIEKLQGTALDSMGMPKTPGM